MDATKEDPLERAKRLARRIKPEEQIERGLRVLEGTGFDRDQIDEVAGMIGLTAEDLAISISTARPYVGSRTAAGSSGQPSKDDLIGINQRLDEIRTLLLEQRASRLDKEWYTVAEAGRLCGLKPYTLRQACNLGRIPDEWKKKGLRTGKWRIHRDAITSIQNHGLPPVSS